HIFYKGDSISGQIINFAERKRQSEQKGSINSFLPFGHGPHHCPGEELAKQEICEFVYQVVSRFDIQTPDIEEIKKVGFVTLQLEKDVHLIIKDLKSENNIKNN